MFAVNRGLDILNKQAAQLEQHSSLEFQRQGNGFLPRGTRRLDAFGG